MAAVLAGLSTTGSAWRRDGVRRWGESNRRRIIKADDGEAAVNDERGAAVIGTTGTCSGDSVR